MKHLQILTNLLNALKRFLRKHIVNTRFLRTRGKWFKKEIWFSFCSMHQQYDDNCQICNKGTWNNVIKYRISSLIYDCFPSLWRWWVNR